MSVKKGNLLALNDFKKRRSRRDRQIGNTVLGVSVIYVQGCGQIYISSTFLRFLSHVKIHFFEECRMYLTTPFGGLVILLQFRALFGDGHQGYVIVAVANLIYQVFA